VIFIVIFSKDTHPFKGGMNCANSYSDPNSYRMLFNLLLL
jgi:hypothetical protein